MNDRHRFDELWNDFLEGELSPERMKELQELLHDPQWLAQATDQYQLHRLLGMHGQSLDEEENAFVAATMDLLPADQDQFVSEVGDVVSKLEARSESSGKSRQALFPRLRVGLPATALTAAAIVLLGCFLYFGWRSGNPEVEIIELRGQVVLTGDGGKIVEDLDIGHRFAGGTLESLVPDSYCKLRFDDQTTVTISGRTQLTLSQNGQKMIRLRRGNLSANVTPQPNDHPMLVFTEAAELTVLGTEFNVEANTESTSLVVNEGLVRVKRLIDGKQAEVPARQSVTASLEDQNGFSSIKREAPVTVWQSDLRGDVVQGKWFSNLSMKGKRLKLAVSKGEMSKKAASFDDATGSVWAALSPHGSLVVLSPKRSVQQPVLLNANTRVRVRGRNYSQVPIEIGLSVSHPAGGFAGKYRTRITVSEFIVGEDFEINLPISSFRGEIKPGSSLIGNELNDWWCIARAQSAKFEITSVELTDQPEKDKP